MHFSVSSFSLLQELYFLHKIINTKYSLFKFKIFGKKLVIMVSDSENHLVTAEIQVYVKKTSEEKIAIHPKLMIEILKTFPNETIFIKKEKNTLNIYSEQGDYPIPIICHENKNRHHLTIFSSMENFEKGKILKITLFSKILLKILNKTLFATGNEEIKPVMNGVFFRFSPKGATFVATDTYKLVKYTLKNIKSNQYIEFIISRKSLRILKNILFNEKKSVTIEYKKTGILKFSFETKTFLCELINEKYPDYNSVFPKKKDISFIINRLFFLNSIKRISLFSKEETNFIRFNLSDNTLRIYEENTRISIFSKIRCKYIAEYFRDESIIKMGFNSKFLIEILSSFKEDFVSFELYSSNRMGIFKPFSSSKKEESTLILIMSIIV
ncbi:DNA polymerase III, beta subunit [Blattabacterium sp. (Periplaneta americana) str. BPLAN]|uniref:DNA polymerase III subunit beta n=1 Tax=Blattabacterium sp. (Periplaneta americana) TaxID=367488 RepID=UPI0001BA0D20|nr:DNA polymerase III subunit beta [Blattabacterium sp. (Periplaneta americana)]ACX84187.1 DNA polymerase III, beta subunit [Blattabacterium sp. (Periplaneta americana) str. BPLAN]